MNEKKEQKGKKTLLACIAVALVCAISVGSTLALSKATSNDINNTFTTPEISLMLTEPAWDGDADGDGKLDSGVKEETLGMNLAKKYYNGQELPKDPKLTNTSDYDEYVAIKLKFFVLGDTAGVDNSDYTEITEAEFMSNVATFRINTGWTGSNGIYYYKTGSTFTTLPKKTETVKYETPTLFDNVEVVATATGTIYNVDKTIKVSWTKLPKFEIKITGYAVQADNITETDVQAELDELMK